MIIISAEIEGFPINCTVTKKCTIVCCEAYMVVGCKHYIIKEISRV